MMKNKQLFGSLMLLFAAILWGLSYSVQVLCSGLGTFAISFFKTVGGVVLLIIGLIKKERFNKKTILSGSLIGSIACAGVILQQKGLELSSAANASFITALYIIFTPIMSVLIGKKPKPRIYLSIIISLIGMYLLCIKGAFILKTGDIILVFSAILFALQIILIDKFANDVDTIAFTAVQQLTGAILTGIIMFVIEKPSISIIGNNILQIIYLSLFAGAGAQLIQNRFQKDVEPSLASILMSFESVFGAIFGWLVLNQILSLKEIIGCILMFMAMLIAE